MKLDEPTSCRPAAPTVFVGRDRRGNWIACEQNGIFGGLFVNRAQALKYALRENGYHPETVVELSHDIELDISASQESTRTKRVASQACAKVEQGDTAFDITRKGIAN